MNNIPIYRAKKKDSDEWVEGYLTRDTFGFTGKDKYHINIYDIRFEIDPKTLSIHFPNMIAKNSNRSLPNGEKDLRIFASFGEDGVGGDTILSHYKNVPSQLEQRDEIAVFNDGEISAYSKEGTIKSWVKIPLEFRVVDRGQVFIENCEITGIRKG